MLSGDKYSLTYSVTIQLIPFKKNYAPLQRQVNALMSKWKKAAEDKFNAEASKWELIVTSGRCCKNGVSIQYAVDFIFGKSKKEDIEVNISYVSPPDLNINPLGGTNQTNWELKHSGVKSPPYHSVIHEIGHSFGLDDEYYDGLEPDRKRYKDEKDSIMGNSSNQKAKFMKRHIEATTSAAKIKKNHSVLHPYKIQRKIKSSYYIFVG